MLSFYRHHHIDAVDLAVRRSQGAMIWHYRQPLQRLPVAWLRAENLRHAECYIRPARDQSWPMVFLDDVAPAQALRVASRYGALVVQTSPAGGCHLWLSLTQPLDQRRRYLVQRWLIARLNADPGSVSGEHLGRLAGMRNWKRQGCWVNVLNPYPASRPCWDPTPALTASCASPMPDYRSASPITTGLNPTGDTSPSAREWGWVCGALQAGIPPDFVYRKLLQRASDRRGRDAERYARYTLRRALQRLR
jgi:hypothetical protein